MTGKEKRRADERIYTSFCHSRGTVEATLKTAEYDKLDGSALPFRYLGPGLPAAIKNDLVHAGGSGARPRFTIFCHFSSVSRSAAGWMNS